MTHAEKWLYNYNLLIEYKKKHGHVDVPLRYVTKDGDNLGTWVYLQRQNYKHKKLAKERIDLLNAISFKWSIRVGKDFTWDDWFKLLVEYKNKFGHPNVPINYVTEDGYKLGAWFNTQVKALNGYYNISEEHIERLENLGVSFYRCEDNWNNKFEQIESVINKRGYSFLTLKQMQWLSYQRQKNIAGELGEVERNLLENIGINLTDKHKSLYKYGSSTRHYTIVKKERARSEKLERIRNENWMAKYIIVKEYYLEHGNLDVKSDYVTEDGFQMGAWINTQKYAYRKRKLKEYRVKLLNEISFSFTSKKLRWNDKYEIAKEYYLEHGNLDVDADYIVDGIKLAEWINDLRIKYSLGLLNKEEIDLLNSIGMIWKINSSITNSYFDKYYSKFKEVYDNNNCDINLTYMNVDYNTKKWVLVVRDDYSKYNLSNKRTKLLNDMFFDWNTYNTKVLNGDYDNLEYRKIMLERMKHILEDLSYEIDGSITDISKQKEIEKEIIKRMWR